MLRTGRSDCIGDLLVVEDQWRAYEMIFTPEKLEWLWEEMNKYRTLFTDITRGDIASFVALVSMENTYWMEVVNIDDVIIGVVYVEQIQWGTDAIVHINFFDRKPSEKAKLCLELARVVFKKFKFHRLSATIPEIYFATIRTAEKVGFKREGLKRQALSMNGKWINEVQLGLLAEEVM